MASLKNSLSKMCWRCRQRVFIQERKEICSYASYIFLAKSNILSKDHRIFNKNLHHYTTSCDPVTGSKVEDITSMKNTEKAIAISKSAQKSMIQESPQQPPDAHCLRVAILGAPNAGKSTLANRLIGWRFAAVSSKVHTTRHKAVGVLTENNKQIIFLDTPGLVTPDRIKRHKLAKTLLLDPHSSLFSADLIAVVVDISEVWHQHSLDSEILKALYLHQHKPTVLILNKVDAVKPKDKLLKSTRILTEGIVGGRMDWMKTRTQNKNKIDPKQLFDATSFNQQGNLASMPITNVDTILDESEEEKKFMQNIMEKLAQIKSTEGQETDCNGQDKGEVNLGTTETWTQYYRILEKVGQNLEGRRGWPLFQRVFMVSALLNDGVEQLKEYLLACAKPGTWVYSGRLVTDQNPMVLVQQCVREQMLNYLPDEIPYEVNVVVELWEEGDDGSLQAVVQLVCYRARQIKIVLEESGERIKKIAIQAEKSLQDTFQRDVHLKLTVVMRDKK